MTTTSPRNLNIPFFSQRDNEENASGSCNVTSCSMALYYLGIRGDKSRGQLEDQLYDRAERLGIDRHSSDGLRTLLQTYPGVIDDLTLFGTFDDIRKAIDKKQPCIVHGYPTRSGHIWVIRGYDSSGFLCNDPWGEWSPNGYITEDGENVHYSTRAIGALCTTDSYEQAMDLYNSNREIKFQVGISGIWLHRVRRIA
jgi:uncharacterized protein YvpB